ncbi:MAG: hypothetical protein U0524_01620 [Candidatus Saccharimonadales bacterium]
MEGAPFIPEQHDDDPERLEKRIPKTETIGSLAVETNPEKDPDNRTYSHEHLGKTLISKEALKETPEVNYEQDPVLRHAQSAGAISRASGWIGSLLSSKSDLDLGSSGPASDDAGSTTSTTPKTPKASNPRSAADMIMLSVIVGLLFLIILVIILKS